MHDDPMLHPYFDKSSKVDTSRRDLPHREQEAKLQFVTFRLFDSLPQEKLNELAILKEKIERGEVKDEKRVMVDKLINKWLDQGMGCCCLRDPRLRAFLENSLRFVDNDRCTIYAYVIMPNHVHILLQTNPGEDCATIMGSVRQFSAKHINLQLNRRGALWMKEPFDRLIRSREHLLRTVDYIKKNPSFLPLSDYTLYINESGINYLRLCCS